LVSSLLLLEKITAPRKYERNFNRRENEHGKTTENQNKTLHFLAQALPEEPRNDPAPARHLAPQQAN
jgi:hypothetical protein